MRLKHGGVAMADAVGSKHTHLQLIQGVVNRLAQSSFLLKGWSVILVAGLFAFAAKESRVVFTLLAYIPALAFWTLDGYCLWQERLYRALYDHVRSLPEESIDFSMSTKPFAKKETYGEAFFSRTLLWFHGSLVLTIVAVMVFLPRN
jgi:hypothetical protein